MDYETDRWLYLVEHDLRGLPQAQLASVHRALGEAVRREIGRGGKVRYARRIDVPDEHRCRCLFEAASPEVDRAVNGIAVAFGILLDTIVVRAVLVTALNLDVGRGMWRPSTLARTPGPAPAELSHERASAPTGA